MSNQIIPIGQSTNDSNETRCPWCKKKVPASSVDAHKSTCTDRRPVPSITIINPGFVTNQPHMQ